MEIIKYPDGSSYVQVSEFKSKKITWRINSYEDLWHLNQYIDAYWHFHNKKPTIILPSLFDGQADQRFHENESAGLKLICRFLNDLKADFRIFHPHNKEVVMGIMDNARIIDNSEFIIKVLMELSKFKPNAKEQLKSLEDNLIIIAPDAGAYKWINDLVDKIKWDGEVYSASKARIEEDGIKKTRHFIERNDFGGKDVILLDDLSIFGGTFKKISKLLKNKNIGNLYLAVSHMTVMNLGKDPVTNYFDKVFTTNSKYDEYFNHYQKSLDNLKVFKIF